MTCTQPIRAYIGIKHKNAILSSGNNVSERINRPATRSRMIMVEKRVAHQQTKTEGLTWAQGRSSGASEYSVISRWLSGDRFVDQELGPRPSTSVEGRAGGTRLRR